MDEFIIMPNHTHGIIVFGYNVGAQCARGINQMRNSPGFPVWQRNYYEHIIRNEDEMNRIREYIIYNPAKWAEDENNPANIKS